MGIFQVFLYALVVIVALLLIGLVLIQPAKSGGMGATFGGIGESMFGGKAGSKLTKATVFMTALFFSLVLLLAMVSGLFGRSSEIQDALDAKTTVQTAPATQTAPADKK